MSKALEILEQIRSVDENKHHKTRTIIFNSDDMNFLDEAIAELEATDINRREWYQKGYSEAINGRTCATCKHWEDEEEVTNEEAPRRCYKGVSDGYVTTLTDKNFCCNKYESKDIK